MLGALLLNTLLVALSLAILHVRFRSLLTAATAAARATEAVYEAMGAALRAVCPQDIRGWVP